MNSTMLAKVTWTSWNNLYQKDITAAYQEAYILCNEVQIVP